MFFRNILLIMMASFLVTAAHANRSGKTKIFQDSNGIHRIFYLESANDGSRDSYLREWTLNIDSDNNFDINPSETTRFVGHPLDAMQIIIFNGMPHLFGSYKSNGRTAGVIYRKNSVVTDQHNGKWELLRDFWLFESNNEQDVIFLDATSRWSAVRDGDGFAKRDHSENCITFSAYTTTHRFDYLLDTGINWGGENWGSYADVQGLWRNHMVNNNPHYDTLQGDMALKYPDFRDRALDYDLTVIGNGDDRTVFMAMVEQVQANGPQLALERVRHANQASLKVVLPFGARGNVRDSVYLRDIDGIKAFLLYNFVFPDRPEDLAYLLNVQGLPSNFAVAADTWSSVYTPIENYVLWRLGVRNEHWLKEEDVKNNYKTLVEKIPFAATLAAVMTYRLGSIIGDSEIKLVDHQDNGLWGKLTIPTLTGERDFWFDSPLHIRACDQLSFFKAYFCFEEEGPDKFLMDLWINNEFEPLGLDVYPKDLKGLRDILNYWNDMPYVTEYVIDVITGQIGSRFAL